MIYWKFKYLRTQRALAVGVSDKKCGWLQRIFPQIDINKALIRLVQKQLIDVDILIDDCYGNLAGDTYYSKILLDKPWNRNLDDIKESILRYNNWKDIKSEIYR